MFHNIHAETEYRCDVATRIIYLPLLGLGNILQPGPDWGGVQAVRNVIYSVLYVQLIRPIMQEL